MGFITLTDGTVIHGSQLPVLNTEPLEWYEIEWVYENITEENNIVLFRLQGW